MTGVSVGERRLMSGRWGVEWVSAVETGRCRRQGSGSQGTSVLTALWACPAHGPAVLKAGASAESGTASLNGPGQVHSCPPEVIALKPRGRD